MNERGEKDQIDQEADKGHQNQGFEIEDEDNIKMDTLNDMRNTNREYLESHDEGKIIIVFRMLISP